MADRTITRTIPEPTDATNGVQVVVARRDGATTVHVVYTAGGESHEVAWVGAAIPPAVRATVRDAVAVARGELA